jgi:hypothetical protein
VKLKSRKLLLAPAIGACVIVAGCGGGARTAGGTSASGAGQRAGSASPAGTSSVPSDAQSAATGDIPDNQAFLTFTDRAAGYSIRYPEGWTQRNSAGEVTFQDRANVIHLAVLNGPPPRAADLTGEIARLRLNDPTIASGSPRSLTVNGSPVLKITFTRLSGADPVTGKRLRLTIDRYEYAHVGKVAILDLGTPKGVDNVDAYRMISRSFQWR